MELKDEFSGTSKILARESSAGQSSRIYYRSGDFEGVPLRWEILPGTPLNPQRDHDILPLSPPPSMQGLGLPLPKNISDEEDNIKASKYKVKGLKKMAKVKAENLSKRVETLLKRRSNKERLTRSRLGEKIVLVSNNGIPFKWEQYKTPPEDALISPPSPPLAVQSSALPRPKARCFDGDVRESKCALIRALFLRRKTGIKMKKKDHHEVSFRYNEHAKDEIVSCGLNWSKGKILGFARKKLKFLKM